MHVLAGRDLQINGPIKEENPVVGVGRIDREMFRQQDCASRLSQFNISIGICRARRTPKVARYACDIELAVGPGLREVRLAIGEAAC